MPDVRRRSGACDLKDEEQRIPGEDPLLERIRRREPAAIEALYERTGRQAFGVAYRLLGDSGAAEDAVQEAFLTIWRTAERLDPARGRLDALLLTIVHRRAIDFLRARSRGAVSLPDGYTVPDLDTDDPLDAIVSAQDGALVRETLTTLPPEQRIAIEKAYFEGLTHAEIAAQLDIPPGTVKSRLRLGLQKMRSTLAPEVR